MLSFQNGIEARLNNWINYTQRVFDARNVAVDLDVANIIVRGRKNLQNLKETEQMVFKKYLLKIAVNRDGLRFRRHNVILEKAIQKVAKADTKSTNQGNYQGTKQFH